MKKLDTALIRVGLGIGAVFAYLIAIEAGLLSARFQGNGILFRWQVWCLAGIVVIAARDKLSSTYCHECHEWEVPTILGLFTTGKVVCRACLEREILDAEQRHSL